MWKLVLSSLPLFVPGCMLLELQWRVHTALKTTRQRDSEADCISLLGMFVFVRLRLTDRLCTSSVRGNERWKEEDEECQRGPLTVWDWDRGNSRGWPWGSISPATARETERTQSVEETAVWLSCFSVAFLQRWPNYHLELSAIKRTVRANSSLIIGACVELNTCVNLCK